VYTDEARASGKGAGKELCDLLIVFGNTVILFSDKEWTFQEDEDITVKKVLAQFRQNQGRFKALLKKVWSARCAVSGCREESVLEGAHIIPYAAGRDYSKSNGLLLRADIHALFDARLLSVDADGRVHVAASVKDTSYSSLQGKKLTLPKAKWPPKLADTFAERHAEYLEAHG
jgi:putative restriction endonuclease